MQWFILLPLFFVLCNTDQPSRQLATCSTYDWHITTVETAAIFFCPYPHKYQQGKERWTEKSNTMNETCGHLMSMTLAQPISWLVFLMAILSFRHKPLFTIIYNFFYYNTFRWFKSKFRHSCVSKSFIMNWHGWVLFDVCAFSGHLRCVRVFSGHLWW